MEFRQQPVIFHVLWLYNDPFPTLFSNGGQNVPESVPERVRNELNIPGCRALLRLDTETRREGKVSEEGGENPLFESPWVKTLNKKRFTIVFYSD